MVLKKQHVAFLESLVDIYPDFPILGVTFRDLSPIYTDFYAMEMIQKHFVEEFNDDRPDCIIGCDARGFIIGTLLSQSFKVPLVLARKPGKLPGEIITKKYGLEYGHNELQMHKHIITQFSKPMIADDVLATGGTVNAVRDMLYDIGISCHSCVFISEIIDLEGRKKIREYKDVVVPRVSAILKS